MLKTLFLWLKFRYQRVWMHWKGKKRTFMEFPDLPTKKRKIMRVFSEYNTMDLYRAIFVIGVFYRNRSALSSRLALNDSLINCKKDGNKPIKTYEDFAAFFSKLQVFLKTDSFDDLTISDFGEVKLAEKDEKYNIIIGTGHNQVYENNVILSILAQMVGKDSEYRKAVQFFSNLIDAFKETNHGEMPATPVFELPPRELFECIKNYFDNELDFETTMELKQEFIDENQIEKKHFITLEDRTYPLWNESFLVDLFSSWYVLLSEKQIIDFADRALANILNSFDIVPNNPQPKIYLQIRLFTDKDILNNMLFSFAYIGSKNVLIGLNADRYTKEQIDSAVAEFEQIKELKLAETFSRGNSGIARGLQITDTSSVELIIYDSFVDINSSRMTMKGQQDHYEVVSALDVIDYLLFSENPDEIVEYLRYDFDSDYNMLQIMGGDAARFFTWKDNHHLISKGALQYGLVSLSYDTDARYVFDYFTNELRNFPWQSRSLMFTNPHEWLVKVNNEDYFDEFVSKAFPIGGFLKRFSNGATFFLVKNATFFSIDTIDFELQNTTPIVEDIIKRVLSSIKDTIENNNYIKNTVIEIMYMPKGYADKASKGTLLRQKSKYVYSDCMLSEDMICIRYTTNIDVIYQDISKVSDRSVEVDFFLELFEAIRKYIPAFYDDICNACEKLRNQLKHVDVFTTEIDYKWNDSGRGYEVCDNVYCLVKKEIAKACLEQGITPGEYHGKEANDAIRKTQSLLIPTYERMVSKYNKYDLHVKLLERYAREVHNVEVHRKSFTNFNNLDPTIRAEVQSRTIEDREKGKRNSRNLLYLIETNLSVTHVGDDMVSNEQLEFLMGYSDWLVTLNDSADICHFTDMESFITVSDEFIVDTVLEESIFSSNDMNGLLNRVYHDPGYGTGGSEEDNQFIDSAKLSFQKDTGIPFDFYMTFLYYLVTGNEIPGVTEVRPNVLCVDESVLVEDFAVFCKNKISRNDIKNVMNYAIIDADRIKTVKGKTLPFLQFGERENRDNRFEVKGVWRNDGKIVFSPGVESHIQDLWLRCFMDFFMPYEIGLKNMKATFNEWKKLYERKFVFDIEQTFKEHGYIGTHHNMELWKEDKGGNHPRDLGDYDVFAVNQEKREIWIVECKVLGKVGSLYEYYHQQQDFFLGKREDEHFQKRIDYLKDHYEGVLRAIGIDVLGEYTIIPYMVMNKIMISRYKKISFEVISFGELVKLIEAVS